jgi:hypothetical protein
MEDDEFYEEDEFNTAEAECASWGHVPLKPLIVLGGTVVDNYYVSGGFELSFSGTYNFGNYLAASGQQILERTGDSKEIWEPVARIASPATLVGTCTRCNATLFRRSVPVPDDVNARDCRDYWEAFAWKNQPGTPYYHGLWYPPDEVVAKINLAYQRRLTRIQVDQVALLK